MEHGRAAYTQHQVRYGVYGRQLCMGSQSSRAHLPTVFAEIDTIFNEQRRFHLCLLPDLRRHGRVGDLVGVWWMYEEMPYIAQVFVLCVHMFL